ncbi:MAG TPA: urate hydroxylase PuuD [Burkholderiaceae bacterium]|nr:urate hydroxylase PuuD [Burkholderiaceae bacterium]
MGAILQSLGRTVAAGIVLLIVLIVLVGALTGKWLQLDHAWGAFFMRWLHVLSGVMWIGLLWYFNFVQIPSMPKIPDEQKPAVGKVIAPTALFWFRWAALATVITGILLGWMNGYIGQALALQQPFTAIGIGMWLGLIMAFNVWFIIWPNQKKALGIVQVGAEEKTKAARLAMLISRTNTLLSIPMLYMMVAQQNAGLLR